MSEAGNFFFEILIAIRDDGSISGERLVFSKPNESRWDAAELIDNVRSLDTCS
jgi:hypothetical protein